MSAEQMTSLVQRKARTGRDAHAARAMSLGRALRLTAAKQADQLMGLAVGALSVTQKTLSGEGVVHQLAQDSLYLLMDGPGGQVAAAMLEPPLVAGLIQQQTMGKISPDTVQGGQRPCTATDAALCAPFVEALLRQAALLPEKQDDRDLLAGYRFGVWARAPRQVQLALEASSYELLEMTLDLAAGARAGKLALLMPEPVKILPQETAETEEGGSPRPAPAVTLDKHVMEMNAELTIALTRLKLPLQQVTQFKAGDVVDLNISSMAQALVIDASGKAITRGTLGQIEGVRALQVEQQKTRQHTQPRRRESDRDALDLPDVTGEGSAADEAPFAEYHEDANVPNMSDVDIFGDIDALPDMPDFDDPLEMDAGTGNPQEDEGKRRTAQSGW